MRSAYLTKSVTQATVRALNYTPEVEAFRAQGKDRRSVCLSDLICGMGESYGKVFVRYDCAPDQGEELLTQSDMFAVETEGRIIRGNAIPGLEDHRLYRWQILIAGAGTLGETELYGRSIIVDKRLEGKIIGPHAIRVTFPNPGDDINLFVYAFLCSPTGIRLVRSTSFGTKILSLREDLLRSLPIPLPNNETLRRVADLIRSTVTNREQYLSEVQAARACLEALPEMQEAIRMCQERKAYCTLWNGNLPTLTAWTYASAGDALGYLQKKWGTRVGAVVKEGGIYRGGRYARIRCEPPNGYDFYSQRDAFLIRPIPQRIVVPSSAGSDLFCNAGTLLCGGQGTLGEGEIFGRVVLVDSEMAKAAITEHLLRIRVTEEFSKLAYTYFSTIVGFRFMRSCAVGTKLLSLRPSLIRALPFPEVDEKTKALIDGHVEAAMNARVAAASAEKEAIRIIEEEVLPQWLA